jgi:WD40 repeat protein
LVQKLWFSPEGDRLMAQEQLAVYGWEVASGREAFRFIAGNEADYGVYSDPQGQHFVTFDDTNQVRFWKTADESALVTRLKGVDIENIRKSFFSPDGRRFCTGGDINSARAWEESGGQELCTIPARVYQALFSPDGERLLTSGYQTMSYLWNLKTGQQLLALKGHSAIIRQHTFSPDGRLVATGDSDGTVKIWSARHGRGVFQGDMFGWGIAWHPNGREFIGGVHWAFLSGWEADSGAHWKTYQSQTELVNFADYSPDGKKLVTIGIDRIARIFEAESGRHLAAFTNHQRGLWGVDWSPDGRAIATSDAEGTILIWEPDTQKILQRLRLGITNTWQKVWWPQVKFSPDGRQLLSSAPEARVWDVASGKLRLVLPGQKMEYCNALFTPDGRQIITAGGDSTLRYWDARSGALQRTLPTRGLVTWMDITPDGTRLAICIIAPNSGTLSGITGKGMPIMELWDVPKGRFILSLTGHSDLPNLVRFSPDGRRLLSCAGDFTLRQWETFPWQESDYARFGAGNLAAAIRQYADRYWAERLAAEATAPARSVAKPELPLNHLDRSFWPPRPPEAGPNQVDLTAHYNGTFDKRATQTGGDLHVDDDLRQLPQGLVNLGGIPFDIRGSIVLRKRTDGGVFKTVYNAYPVQIEGIKIGRKFQRLQVLHGSRNEGAPLGTAIGAYVLHYADGTQQELEIVYGRDVLDLWKEKNEPAVKPDRAVEAWTGSNPTTDISDASLRLFRRTYENPKPDVEVVSVDYVSKMARCVPFLIAVTVE